jgi:hypothetical protein
VVRSHYGQDARVDGEKIYRAGNAIADWLGLYSWADIPLMQQPDAIEKFRCMLKNAP